MTHSLYTFRAYNPSLLQKIYFKYYVLNLPHYTCSYSEEQKLSLIGATYSADGSLPNCAVCRVRLRSIENLAAYTCHLSANGFHTGDLSLRLGSYTMPHIAHYILPSETKIQIS